MNELRTEERELTTADLASPSARSDAQERVADETPRDREDVPGRAKPMPLFTEAEMQEFRAQWSSLQTGFVDEPRRAVETADKLVASVMQRLAEGFANERSGLEKQWDRGDNVSTEDLRVALQRYRSFFSRLLNL